MPQSSNQGILEIAATQTDKGTDAEEEVSISVTTSKSKLSVQSPTTRISTTDPIVEPTGRERRTQVFFFVFGCIAVSCLPLILALVVRPLVATTTDLTFSQNELSSLLTAANTSVHEIETSYLNSVANKTTTLAQELETHCPSTAAVLAIHNIDFEIVFAVASPEAGEVDRITETLVRNLQKILGQFTGLIETADTYLRPTRRFLWIPPVMLFSLSIGIIALMIAVYSSWNRKSTARYQNLMSYGVLPFVLVCIAVCWTILLGAVVSTSVVSDICRSADDDVGSAQSTIEDVLEETFFTAGSPTFDFTAGFTSGCASQDFVQEIETLSKRTGTIVDILHSTTLLVDTVGKDQVGSTCSNGNSGEDNYFFALLPRLVQHYSSIQFSLDDLADTLACEDTHRLFDDIVNEALCTEIASALSWGCILFGLLGVSSMVVVSLRAAWRHHVVEDRIYDESEVAENMILDEHEEYLVYISKFRHEWEEYQGVDPSLREQQQVGDTDGQQTDSPRKKSLGEPPKNPLTPNDSMASEDQSQLHINSMLSEDPSTLQDSFDPYVSDSPSVGASTDSISFQSLKDPQQGSSSSPRHSTFPSLLITSQPSDTSCLEDEIQDLLETPKQPDLGEEKPPNSERRA